MVGFTEDRSKLKCSLLACRPRAFHCRNLAVKLWQCLWSPLPSSEKPAEQQSGLRSLLPLDQPDVRACSSPGAREGS